jgi:collagenase-like PrtC family protease
MTKTKLELLAPAKNLESGIAALNCGADAVYTGANSFGARASAGNSLSVKYF